MLVFGAYVIYGLSNGLDFDHGFMGVVRGRHGKAEWPVLVIVELQLVAVFIIQRFSDEPETFARRLVYILWGVLGLCFTIWGGGSQAMHEVGHVLGFYVWVSNIAYGFVGSNDE